MKRYIQLSKGLFENHYQRDKYYWGDKPSSVLESNLHLLRPGSVLDVGAGDGRNTLFLARKGFDVVALDVAPTGLSNIVEKTRAAGITSSIQTIVADAVTYEFNQQYENVISNFTLHFVGSDNIQTVIEKLMSCTVPGGINLIDDFTRNGPLAANHPENFMTEEWLESFYKDASWEVLYHETRPVLTKVFESPSKPLQHEAIGLIARKPNPS